MNISLAKTTLLILGSILVTACASTSPDTVSHDGLVLKPDSKFAQVYVRPDASLAGYSEYGLESCEVAFKKNWLRDQNSNRMDLSNRVTQQDVDRIKDSLGELCDTSFREALEQEPAYTLVDDFSNGEAVLVLRPGIIDLDINAPDIMSAGRSRTYTTSEGEMTLLLEILDGTTGEILVRIVDRRRGMDSGRLEWTNGVTNRAEAQRNLNRWSKQLRQGLDQATAE